MSTFYFPGEENSLRENIASFQKHVLIADAKTNGFCLPHLRTYVPESAFWEVIVLPDGEANKTMEVMQWLWTELTRLQVTRHDLLWNVGGGVLSDMGGFAAATYKRGISFINIPTTLTAMIDASIGGKTGIDWMGYKNLIGCFHNPLAIYVQPAFLNTLDLRQIQSGVVEMWKHALIDSPEAWEKIRHKAPADFIGLEFIQTSIKIKNNLVRIDPLDQKERQALNVGHSLGHAIEALALQLNKKLLHGEAVLFGMIYECTLAENLLGLTPSLREQLLQLKQHYFPELAIFWNMEDLIPFLMQDKKNQEGIRMSLLAHPGDVRIGCLVSMEEILKISLHD